MRIWTIAAIASFSVMPLAMCVSHHRPVYVDNDTGEAVKAEFTNTLLNSTDKLVSLPPGQGFGGGNDCSRSSKLIFLSTSSHPEMVAYRMKDVCDPDDCSCDIKVSELEKSRRQLSVPWQKAGEILLPSFRR